MKRKIQFLSMVALVILPWVGSHAQEPATSDIKPIAIPEGKNDTFVLLPAGPQYKASGWKQLWWGKHYRTEWLTPVLFPILDWSHAQDGLTPLKLGGGHETKSLRVMGGDGKEYVLRTMDKDLTLKVPQSLRGTYLNDVVNDQISTAHPYGPVVVARLAGSASLPHTNPIFYYVPSNEKDSTFNEVFGGKICMLEERLSGNGWTHTPLSQDADAIVNTEKMLQHVSEDSRYQVDQKAFLKVRLFDMLINDWDRHDDQWVWTAHKEKGKTVYKPFARDRDQAFSRTDGINLYVLTRPWAFRSMQNFNPHIKDVIGQNLSALALDRQFLNALSEEDWLEAVKNLQSSITNEAIHTAVLALPDTIFALSGSYVEQRLRQRRDHLLTDALRYYRFLSKEVDIKGSASNEVIIINNLSAHQVQIFVQKQNEEGRAGDTLYRRTFNSTETNHINLYGMAGNDRYQVMGFTKSFIRMRLIGGAGQDQYERADTAGAGTKIRVFEAGGNMKPSDPVFVTHVSQDSAFLSYDRIAFKPDWHQLTLLPAYNVDDGLILGLGFTYRKRGWMKEPYRWQQRVGASIALGTGAPSFIYEARFTKLVGNWDLGVGALYNGPLYVYNYYGLGNETILAVENRSYYRVHAQELRVEPYLAKTSGKSELRIGLRYQTVTLKNNENRFIATQADKLDSNIFSLLQYGGSWASYNVDKRDELLFPAKGYGWTSYAEWTSSLNKGSNTFVRAAVSVYGFLPVGPLVLAHRTGASTITNNSFQFYQASTLDGHSNLRGYWQDRYAGKTAFYQNTELRYKIHNAKGYVLRGSFGIFGFFDDGRVWMPEEHSTLWHIGYGGGIFIIPYNFIVFSATYGRSNEATTLTLKTGLYF